jgi:nicotinate-nucleotide adenylyltransferase
MSLRSETGIIAKPPPAFPSMRIGLLGGSFNPPHAGHLHISLAAIKRLRLDKLWWLVTPGNPLKGGGGLAPLPERMALARSMARHPKIEVTDFEAARPSAYAIDTIGFLLNRRVNVQYCWVMGGDILAQFHRWRDWSAIFAALPILVLDRPGARHSALASPAARRFSHARLPENFAPELPLCQSPAWIYLTIPLCDLSSTVIRLQNVKKKSHI